MIKKWFYLFVCFSVTCVSVLAQPGGGGPPDPPGDANDGAGVNDALPLEHDLLMIFLAVGLAILYFKYRPLFWGKKNNS
jgi:hypothetical protein